MTASVPEQIALLREIPLFASLPVGRLHELVTLAQPVSLPAGAVLFERGAPGDALYVIRHGRLEVLVDGEVVREAGRGEVLGELALLTGRPRNATIRARRDAELYAVRRADLDVLLADPASARALVRHLAARIPGSAAPVPVRTGTVLALVPFDDRTAPALVRRLGDRLAVELGRHARVATLDEDAADGPARLEAAEAAHELVLLVAERPDDAWARFCLRQADRPLILADTARGVPPGTVCPLPAATQLVLVGHAKPGPWLQACTAHHLIGPDLPADDVARLGRRLAGRAVGLVLSGGGARGLAHIGVVEELRRGGILIDRVGGTSMGAVVAGLLAIGVEPADMLAIARRELVARRPFSDVTWPRHGLVRGLRLAASLRRAYGPARIEDQRTSMFTVSVDLVAAEKVVHRRGPIADAVALSVRLPGVVPPQRVGEQLHVDGGVLDNLPIGVMAAEGEGPVLAVDVAEPFGEGAAVALPHIVDTVGRAMTIASRGRDDPARALAREVIVPDLGEIRMFDFRRLDDLVDLGRAAGRAAAARLVDLRSAP
ncbi:MAG: patatin-like phospholipase family protein [Pseudonocardia sp.]|nr:patatin-like phospholipase family protein [Pseudonocardia sp.]